MSNSSKKIRHIHVTCAIIEHEELVLATQRSATMSMPLKWEFPGGKIEPGESKKICLQRELLEELGIQARIQRSLPRSMYRYPTFTITLYPFLCTIESGVITLHEHAAMRWMHAEDLTTLDWAEADVPVLEYYLSLCSLKHR